MKLAVALQERADLNRQIEQLQARLYNNAVVQEGEEPAEDPQELMDQLDRAAARLEELMAAINLANCRTVVDGLTLTERIARKDCLRLRLEAYRELVQAASQTARRATRSEIRILSAVDVRALQGKVDAMARSTGPQSCDGRRQVTGGANAISAAENESAYGTRRRAGAGFDSRQDRQAPTAYDRTLTPSSRITQHWPPARAGPGTRRHAQNRKIVSGFHPGPARALPWTRRGSTPNPARFFIKKRGKKFWERSVRFAHGKNMLPDTGEDGTMVTGTLTPIGTLYREEEGRPHGRGL